MGTVNRAGHPALTSRVYKALAIFSGTQSVGILCSVIRTKIVALWIGAVGVGIFGILNAAIEMIASLTQLNLRSTAVRELASERDGSQNRRIIEIVTGRWALVLGLIGMILMAVFSPLLADISLGDRSLWWMFAILSPVMLMGSVTNGRQAVMQADGNLKAIAGSALWSAVVALIISVPMLWYMRLDGIVPVIIIYSATTLVATVAYSRRKQMKTQVITSAYTLEIGKRLLRLGFFMTLSGFLTWGSTWAFMSWLRSYAGDEVAGFYQAGNTILIRYAGILFSAIGMEYYPRIAAVAHDRRRLGVYVGHEILILLKIALPLALLFLIVAPWIVRLLYTEEFGMIVPYISIGTIGLIARVGAWCISFMIIVRSDGLLFMLTEALSAGVSFGLGIICFNKWGVIGLGYAFSSWYLVYLAAVWVICSLRYNLRINKKAVAFLLTALAVTFGAAVTCLAYRC